MDITHAVDIVRAMEQGMIAVKILPLETFSPFAFNLIAQGHSDVMKMEDRLTFIKRMHERVVQNVSAKAKTARAK